MSPEPNTELIRRTSLRAGHWARRLPLAGGAVGIVGLTLSLLLGRSDPKQLAFSWLVAFLWLLCYSRKRVRSGERRCLHRGGRRPHLCSPDNGRGEMLGERPVGNAW